MKAKKLFLKFGLAVLVLAILTFSSCAQFISLIIRVQNDSTSIIRAYIEYGDYSNTSDPRSIPIGQYSDFEISFYESDCYGEVTVFARPENELHWRYSNGYVAESDWVILVIYPNDFSY